MDTSLAGYRDPGGVWGKASKHEKYAVNLLECHKFHTVQTKKISVAISEGTIAV